MGLSILRLLLFGLGALLFVMGLLVAVAGGPEALIGAFWLLVSGGVLVIAVLIERMRYRSEHAERFGDPPGPGGGESGDAPMQPGFRRTDEVFEDPTSRRRMRVWLSESTGERRYRAED